MKQLSLLLVMCLFYIGIQAQPPKKFNYQGIARNSAGQPLANQLLGLRLSILDSNAMGPVRYSETHTVTTNAYGLYNVAVGGGTILAKEMDSIDWAAGDKYLMVEIDPAGGTNYTSLGATQLLSVPYAMYSQNPGPQGPPGIQGVQGIQGIQGVQGIQGPPGVVGIQGFAGFIQTSIAGNAGMVFVGPSVSVTIPTGGGRLTGAAAAVLGLSSGGPISVRTGMCYLPASSATPDFFVGTNWLFVPLTTTKSVVSSAATVLLPAGAYTVGFCINNASGTAVNFNDYVNGWVIQTQ